MPYADTDLYFMDDDDTINEKNCQVIIEEIEPTTLERKQLNEKFIANTKENDINIINTGISEEPNGNQKFLFWVSVPQINICLNAVLIKLVSFRTYNLPLQEGRR